MKLRFTVATMVVVLGAWWAWTAQSPPNKKSVPTPQRHAPAHARNRNRSASDLASQAVVIESGEANSRAIDWLVAAAKTKEQLPTSDIKSLLTFISSPKPGDLTDGEWEERVNVILNLLRRQTEPVAAVYDRRTFSGEKEGNEGAMKKPADGHRPPLQTETAVPGLTEVLLEMAEKNRGEIRHCVCLNSGDAPSVRRCCCRCSTTL
jgi:hypothetical protein